MYIEFIFDVVFIVFKHDEGCTTQQPSRPISQPTTAVKDEIVDQLGMHLPNGGSDAKALLQRLQRVGKFSIEAWS